MVVILAAVVLVILLLAIALALKARRTGDKRHAKRNVKTSESLLKSAKDANRDMCIIVPDEGEKPPDIQYQNPPEVITMTNPYIDDLYCPRDSKPPSPYEYQKEEHKRENVFVRLHHSLTRRKKHQDSDRSGEDGSQLQTFGTLDKGSISPRQSIESRIEDAHNRWLPDVQAGLEPERVHIITGMTTPC